MLLSMNKENIVILGGGIAGMTAAAELLRLGYTPILVEASDHLGGHVAEWHRLFPDMTPAQDVVKRLEEQVSAANVFLSTRVLFINRLGDAYTVMLNNGVSIQARAVLFATGFRLFDAVLGMDIRAFTAEHSGEWMNRLTNDTAVVADGLAGILPGACGKQTGG